MRFLQRGAIRVYPSSRRRWPAGPRDRAAPKSCRLERGRTSCVAEGVLVQAGIDDLCGAGLSISKTMPGAPRSGEQGRATPDTGNPIRQADDSSGATENNRDEARAIANTSPSQEGARIPADEHRRRCSFWALNNLQPVVYSEFAQLNPGTMDDLDRILWRSNLYGSGHLGYYNNDRAAEDDSPLLLPRNPGIYCRDYWA